MLLNNVRVITYSAWIEVESIHGGRLEFVLKDAERRKGITTPYHVYCHYFSLLQDELEKHFQNTTSGIVNYQEYGSLMIQVSADSYEDLQAAVKDCDLIITKWLKKYRVENMKVRD